MRLKPAIVVIALSSAGLLAWTFCSVNTDPESVGVAVTTERLASVRAAAPKLTGPCDPVGACTANVTCAGNGTGGCANPGAGCTNGAVTGGFQNKSCQSTNSYNCIPTTVQGCTTTTTGCESTASGCTCTRVLPQPVNVGTVSTC